MRSDLTKDELQEMQNKYDLIKRRFDRLHLIQFVDPAQIGFHPSCLFIRSASNKRAFQSNKTAVFTLVRFNKKATLLFLFLL